MADLSAITLPNNTTYNIKDATARQAISDLPSTIGLTSSYDDVTNTVTLTAGVIEDADNTEY